MVADQIGAPFDALYAKRAPPAVALVVPTYTTPFATVGDESMKYPAFALHAGAPEVALKA